MSAVYLDNAATTRVADEVAAVVLACLVEDFGNPSSAHAAGVAASRRIKTARTEVLTSLGDERGALGELYFTSGGTEADALAVLGAARAGKRRGTHVVLGGLEHPAVIAAGKLLEAEGFQVTTVAPTRAGLIEPAAMAAAVGEKTSLVTCLLVQNELGTIQPVADLARAVRARRSEVHVHCDAVQALGKLAIDVRALGVDSLAVSAHKLHGPKGVGALWLKKGARLAPLWGGSQQDGVRAGTENVPGIAGFGEAARLARGGHAIAPLAARLVEGVRRLRPDVIENGAAAPRVPHIVSLGFPGVPAEPLLHALEAEGVLVSAGSACAAKSKKPSGVLAAIGLSEDVGVLRFSFSRLSTEADVDAALAALPVALQQVSR